MPGPRVSGAPYADPAESGLIRFAYRLALRLGVVDVTAWLESLPAGALQGWWEYYQLEPWDLPREFWPVVVGGQSRRQSPLSSRPPKPRAVEYQPAPRMLRARDAAAKMAERFG